MEWIISKQIAVEAETPEEAVQKISEWKTISLTVSPRPEPAIKGIQLPSVLTNMRTGQPV